MSGILCKLCAKPVLNSNNIFCSVACRNRYIARNRPRHLDQPNRDMACKLCGKPFTRSNRRRGRMFCSVGCRNRYAAKNHGTQRAGQPTPCSVCGGPMSVANKTGICSRTPECIRMKVKAYKMRVRQHPASPPILPERKQLQCRICGKMMNWSAKYGVCQDHRDEWLKERSIRRLAVRRSAGFGPRRKIGKWVPCEVCGKVMYRCPAQLLRRPNRRCNTHRRFGRGRTCSPMESPDHEAGRILTVEIDPAKAAQGAEEYRRAVADKKGHDDERHSLDADVSGL